jgi:hypothetical protein
VLRLDDGVVNVRVGEQTIIDNFKLPDAMRESPRVGLAICDGKRGHGLFRNLHVRRLGDGDEPMQAKSVAEPEANDGDERAPAGGTPAKTQKDNGGL